jgi:SNF2 family DNA or RNA helicase
MSAPKLYDYQKSSVSFGVQNNYCILGLDMGLGKSVVAITIAEETKSKALIICPAYLRRKWRSEINKFYPGKSIEIFESEKDIKPLFDVDYVIISYNLLKQSEKLFRWAEVVIVDEAHYLKSMKTQRTELFHRLVYEYSIKRCLLLTGTPILNRVYEFYSILAICNYDPRFEESAFLTKFPSYVDFANYFSYLKEYEIMRGGRRVKIAEWEGFRSDRKGELLSFLNNKYISYKSEDVLDLPPYVYVDVPLDLKDMPDLLTAFEFFKGENSGADIAIKAEAALLKSDYTIEYTKGLMESVEQVIVYTDHVLACERIAQAFDVTPITGMTPMKTREMLANDFMDKKRRVLVATIGSFSTGIDLYSSYNMVINDFNWVPGVMKQAMYRIRRIGQKNKCFFHRIIGTEQDKIIMKKLEAKMAVINEIF